MKRDERRFYIKLYIVIALCAACLICLVYLGATGGMDRINARLQSQNTASSSTDSTVKASASASASSAASVSPSASASASPSASATAAPSATAAVIDTVSDDSLQRIVNRNAALSADYVPSDLRTVNVDSLREETLRDEAATALEEMFAAAAADGINLVLISGYRSYSYEQQLYDYYTERYGQTYADSIDDQPGCSEHQLGLAVDIDDAADTDYSLGEDFKDTAAYAWLVEHAAEYGYIERYPADGVDSTGILYSPWAFRYVGVEEAEKIKASGKTMEEYYGGLA